MHLEGGGLFVRVSLSWDNVAFIAGAASQLCTSSACNCPWTSNLAQTGGQSPAAAVLSCFAEHACCEACPSCSNVCSAVLAQQWDQPLLLHCSSAVWELAGLLVGSFSLWQHQLQDHTEKT